MALRRKANQDKHFRLKRLKQWKEIWRESKKPVNGFCRWCVLQDDRLFVAVGDTAFCEIVGRQFERDTVSSKNTDAVLAELSSQVCEDHAILVELDAKLAIGQFFYHHAGDFN